MRVSVLGPLEVYDGSDRVDVRGGRLLALLARLAMDAGRMVTVEALALALWDDDRPTDTANALQSLVSRLRRALPDPTVIESRPGGYRLAIDPDDVDSHRFLSVARRGHEALRSGDLAGADTLLQAALGMWRGEVLSDLRDSPFAEQVALELERARTAATEDRLEVAVSLGRGPDVLTELQNLLTTDPLRERLVGLVMQSLYDAGRQAEALTYYEQTRTLLADRLGVDPSAELQEIHLELLRGRPTRATPASVSRRTNLRSALTSFLGRDDELQILAELLINHRLVTLVGPGGAGKTRLAVEAATDQLDLGPVWLVELAPVTDPDDIAQAALDSVDVRDAPMLDTGRRRAPRDALAQLEDVFATGPALIVLDNCEHLVDGAAHLAEYLLSRCPQLRILATSREPLAITGEVLHPVPMLSRPAMQATADEAGRTAAVALFVDRARAAYPSFELTSETVAPVVEICRRLDGLPLAIELAAARLRNMTVHQLAGRLDDRFRLLTGGSRTAVARHRTLRAVVEWSWELLTPEERLLAERFSVFPGGATPEAALAVCLGGTGSIGDAEDAMAALADKSLVQVASRNDGAGTRYRMLETLREYGSEQLAARAELVSARRDHARYYLDLAEEIEPRLRTADQIHWLRVLDSERDNLLSALRFSADDGDADTAMRIGAALGWYWMIKDSHAEAATALRAALDVEGSTDPATYALASGFFAINFAASGGLDWTDNQSLRRLLDGVPDIDPFAGHPLLVLLAPVKLLLADDLTALQDAFEANLAHPDPWAKGMLHLLQVQIAENLGDVDAMKRNVSLALELLRPTGDRWGVAAALTSLGGMLEMAEDYPAAIEAYEEAGRLSAELLPDSRDNAEVLLHLAGVYFRTKDFERGAEFLERAAARAEASGSRFTLAWVDLTRAQLAWQLGDIDAVRSNLDRAETRSGEAMVPPQIQAMVIAAKVQLGARTGEVDGLRELLAAAWPLAQFAQDLPVTATVCIAAASWQWAIGHPEASAHLIGAAAAMRGSPDHGNPDIVRLVSDVHRDLDDATYDAEYAAGLAAGSDAALKTLREALGIADDWTTNQ